MEILYDHSHTRLNTASRFFYILRYLLVNFYNYLFSARFYSTIKTIKIHANNGEYIQVATLLYRQVRPNLGRFVVSRIVWITYSHVTRLVGIFRCGFYQPGRKWPVIITFMAMLRLAACSNRGSDGFWIKCWVYFDIQSRLGFVGYF